MDIRSSHKVPRDIAREVMVAGMEKAITRHGGLSNAKTHEQLSALVEAIFEAADQRYGRRLVKFP